MGRIITILCIIVLIVGGYWWWHNYRTGNVYDGSVLRRDAAMENGTTTMENGQNLGEAHPTPSRSDAPGTLNGDPYNGDRPELAIQTTPITEDPYGAYGPYGQGGPCGPGRTPGPKQPFKPGAYSAPNDVKTNPYSSNPYPNNCYPSNRPPVVYNNPGPAPYTTAGDTQPPLPPDGVRFGGSGIYQWYREGDLTYRINTRTGVSCIIYATMEEWRKPDVYRHACRNR